MRKRLTSSGEISAKYWCFRASFIEIRRAGSRASIRITKSRPTRSKFLKWFSGFTPLNLGKVGLKSGSLWMFVHSLGVGVPWNWKILKIWSISESPLKRGLFSMSSANMHPTAQISTPRLYCFWPSKTSGARYQSVSISWVRVLIGIPKALASPKSAILRFPFRSTNRFWGLRSRWMILLEWQ